MEEKKHSVQLDNRARLTLTGVVEIKSFQEATAEFETSAGLLQITGEGMHMERLDLDSGEVELKGNFISLYYPEEAREASHGFWGRLFR